MNQRPLYVFFHRARPRTFWSAWGSRKRCPRLLRTWLANAIIRLLSRSEITHCAPCYDGAVLSISLRGTEWFAELDYLAWQRETLVEVCMLPGGKLFQLSAVDHAPPDSPLWPTFLRWLTRGRTKALDCVTETCRVLTESGMDVPRHITTPAQLNRWLKQRAPSYPIHRFIDSPH